MFTQLLLIALGGAFGSVARFLFSSMVYLLFSRNFPYGTLFVNVTGSFLVGIIYVLLLERYSGFSNELRSLLIIGVMGGYTTFSSFSLETINLIENGQLVAAVLNILASVTLCLIAVWFGITLGRQL